MALRDAIRVLCDEWTDVERRLDPEDRRLLVNAVRSLTQDPDDEDLMLDVVAHLAGMLSRHHPILAAIAIEDVRSTTTPSVWADVVKRLRQLVENTPQGRRLTR